MSRDVVTVLGGSFYPLHEGHLRILRAATELQRKNGYKVVATYLVPTGTDSLIRKFPGLPESADNRYERAKRLLSENCWVKWHDQKTERKKAGGDDESKTSSGGFHSTFRAISAKHGGARIIQVTGIDSKVKKAIANKAAEDIVVVSDSRAVPVENRDLLCCAFVHKLDAPGAPPMTLTSSSMERMLCSTDFPRCALGNDAQWFCTTADGEEGFHPKGVEVDGVVANVHQLAPVLRAAAFPDMLPPSFGGFRLEWLTDTGITLGAGKQGLVRLMRAGHNELAVKIIPRAMLVAAAKTQSREEGADPSTRPADEEIDEDDDIFLREARAWARLASCNSRATPRPVTATLTSDGLFGIIITEAGIPVTNYLPAEARSDDESSGEEDASGDEDSSNAVGRTAFDGPGAVVTEKECQAFLHRYRRVPIDDIDNIPLTRVAADASVGAQIGCMDPSFGHRARLIVAAGMRKAISELHTSAGLWHRDPKASNFVFMPDGSVRVVDFGVAVPNAGHQSNTKPGSTVPRGSTRLYPPAALSNDGPKYSNAMDAYAVACAAFEVITGNRLTNGYGGVSSALSDSKRQGTLMSATVKAQLYEEWRRVEGADDDLLDELNEHLAWIEKTWARGGTEKKKSRR